MGWMAEMTPAIQAEERARVTHRGLSCTHDPVAELLRLTRGTWAVIAR
jgi:hypothetical protein